MYCTIPNNKTLRLTMMALAMVLLQVSLPAEAGLSCSKGGEFNVSEYLETPSSRFKGPFESWTQNEVNTARALIETQTEDFNAERAGNTLDDLTRTIGESRNRLARTQHPEEVAERFGVRRSPESLTTPFLGPISDPEQPLSYSEIAYPKQAKIGESLKTIYETQTGSVAEMLSLEQLGVVRVEGEDEARLNTLFPYSTVNDPNLSSDITWANFSGEEQVTFYIYKKLASGDGVVLVATGDALLAPAANDEYNAIIWNRIKQAWSEAIGASDSTVFYRKASDFAWLYAHHQPYLRGSASILGVKLWALFASNGYKVELYDKHVDLHALSTMKQEDFNLAPLLGL